MIHLLPHLCEFRLSLPPGHHATCSVVLCPFDPPQGKDLEKDHCHLPRTSLHPSTILPRPSSAAPLTILFPIRSPISFLVPSSAAAMQSAFQLLPVQIPVPRLFQPLAKPWTTCTAQCSCFCPQVSHNSGGGQSPEQLSQLLPSLGDSGLAPLFRSPSFQDHLQFYNFVSFLRTAVKLFSFLQAPQFLVQSCAPR